MSDNVLYTIEDIAGMLGVERHTASKIIKKKMTYISLSEKIIRVRKSDFEDYLNRQARNLAPGLLPCSCPN